MRLPTVARAAAAAAAASLPLWPSTAGAQVPDQEASEVRSFPILGVTCEIYISVSRYGEGAGAETHSFTDHPYCQDTMNNQVSVYYVTTAGTANSVHGSSDGAYASVVTFDAQSVTRSEHYIAFPACDCGTAFTLSPK